MSADPLASRPLRPATRVFVCDDDLDFADQLSWALVRDGFDVRTLRDGKSPTEIFEHFWPDIVLLDIYMPPPDGFEVMNHILRDTRHRPISLMLASGADDPMLDMARQFCGARGLAPVAVWRKPICLSEVLRICHGHSQAVGVTSPEPAAPPAVG